MSRFADLVPIQFKKPEKHPLKIVTFSKVTKKSTPQIAQIMSDCAKHHP